MDNDSKIPEFPNYPTGQHEVIYVKTDQTVRSQTGCTYGLLIAHLNSHFWVLTPIGIRYYGIESECEFVRASDPKWIVIHSTWIQGMEKISNLQSKIHW